MHEWPNIVVTTQDSPPVLLLAVEVKAKGAGIPDAEARMKAYMVHQNCPLGILVTSEDTFFFRNRYTGYEPETIQKIGECRTSELLGAMPDKASVTGPYLERRIEEWLENLHAGGRRSWPPSASEAIESLVVPAVAAGVVRATGPRWHRTGS